MSEIDKSKKKPSSFERRQKREARGGEKFVSPEAKKASDTEGERIAKRISRAGICSRRDAERLIEEGRVTVDGKRIDTPALKVTPTMVVKVDGKPIELPEKPRLWLFHKPAGYITTNKDPEGRRTVFDILPRDLPRVMTVGRLDLNSEGLLLLTNDGALARYLELPATGWSRRYRVRVFGKPTEEALRRLKKGMEVDGVHYGSVAAEVEREQGSNCWLTVTLTEGKKREIRILFEHLGYAVNRLIRVAYGPFQLGNLETGLVKEVPGRILKTQIGHEFFS